MIELLTTGQMREADRITIEAGTPGIELMEAAGAAVATVAMRDLPQRGAVVVLCGPGNNGGDGFVAARKLREAGYAVKLTLLGSRELLRADAAVAAGRWPGAIEDVSAEALAEADVIVDALFGAGLGRPIDGPAAALVARVNASGKPVIAVDVPSGLDGTTGRAAGPVVRARRTVTFFRRKPGHLLLPGRTLCGEVEVAQIGIPEAALKPIGIRSFANEPPLWQHALRWPTDEGHKYSRGHALVLGGEGWTSGAPRLAAMGALRAGAGLVTVAAPFRALPIYAAQLTAVMLREVNNPDGLADVLTDQRMNAVLLGPGLGVEPRTSAFAHVALEAGRPIVLDADALTSFEGQADRLFSLIAVDPGRPVVLTPHAGEFVRLFGERRLEEAQSKLDAARQGAERSGAVVVLKGADTVIAAPDGRAAINAVGTPYLATAGTGDVLGGIILGQLAQGVPAFEAAAASVYMHGAAANLRGPGLISEDIPSLMPPVLAGLAPRA